MKGAQPRWPAEKGGFWLVHVCAINNKPDVLRLVLERWPESVHAKDAVRAPLSFVEYALLTLLGSLGTQLCPYQSDRAPCNARSCFWNTSQTRTPW